ncbi:MAG: hypothetical protein HY885_03770 [Deltaproteobacteria bacterium]|nr:hypothetical protein [Deltaproteobacteria bacterium]
MKRNATEYKSWTNAITFAEAGEWETAREMIPQEMANRKVSWFFRMAAAVAFAESGMQDEAVRMSETDSYVSPASRRKGDFLDTVGLSGIRMTYGVVAVELSR